jgi:tetratricopeptide (TPR) repeat protein
MENQNQNNEPVVQEVIDMLPLNIALMNFLLDPKNPRYNFALGRCYEELGQTASAASYYLRTAEFSSNDLLSYEALLRMSLCFQRQGSRIFTIKGVLLRAISLLPDRPEAYFLLSRIYEINREWQEGYTWAVLGEKMFSNDKDLDSLNSNVEYPGPYVFTFERAVTAWWIGLFDESVYLFRKLIKNTKMLELHTTATKNNIKNLANNWKDPIVYHDTMYEYLKVKFEGSNKITQNYSQCYQDMFVLSMIKGKKNGAFVEIGGGDPFYGNNTYLLEREFGWKGISIDIDPNLTEAYKKARPTKVITGDATKLNYDVLTLKKYDYLQIDCDPAIVSYEVLLKIPFDRCKFAVITFEHDFYTDENSGVREKSRMYLESLGYELVASNIAPDKYNSYEDWWVYPEFCDKAAINKMKNTSDLPKKADDYMLNKIF